MNLTNPKAHPARLLAYLASEAPAKRLLQLARASSDQSLSSILVLIRNQILVLTTLSPNPNPNPEQPKENQGFIRGPRARVHHIESPYQRTSWEA